MAPIKVIGAGVGRTGTDSLRVALDILGYKTHHMKCFFEDSSLNSDEYYNAYFNRDEADWDKLYQNYDAAVDWTAATFYKDLLTKYPDAKVILTVRSADSWYTSIKNTILKASVLRPAIPGGTNYPFRRLVTAVCLDGWIQNPEKFADEEKVRKLYNDHIAEVKRVVPPEQLLVLELGEGWEHMCKFLGKTVPDFPYPSVNSTADFEKYFINGERPNNMDTTTVECQAVTSQ